MILNISDNKQYYTIHIIRKMKNYHFIQTTKKSSLFENVFLVSEVPGSGTFFFFSPHPQKKFTFLFANLLL